jgi:hypothetical protein
MSCERGHRGVRDCGQGRHRRRMVRKAAKPTLHTAECVRESPPHLEGSFSDDDSETEPTENLGIRGQYHK